MHNHILHFHLLKILYRMSAGSEDDILNLPNGRELTLRHYARSIISRHIKALKDDGHHPSQIPPVYDTSASAKKPDVVGILGAGVGGLYTALILQSLGIPFEIIEVSNRIGGRLYTYKFKHDKAGKYDYYVSFFLLVASQCLSAAL